MNSLMGKRLVNKSKLTYEHLQTALEHQRLNGGHIGNSIVKLRFLSEDEVANFFYKFS